MNYRKILDELEVVIPYLLFIQFFSIIFKSITSIIYFYWPGLLLAFFFSFLLGILSLLAAINIRRKKRKAIVQLWAIVFIIIIIPTITPTLPFLNFCAVPTGIYEKINDAGVNQHINVWFVLVANLCTAIYFTKTKRKIWD